MPLHYQIEKPIKRSFLRSKLGKEYFILKRRLVWFLERKKFARINAGVELAHTLIQHKSVMLRPLKDVDMYLQHNKVTNLRIANQRIHKVVILPGQVFSLWKLVGRPTANKGYLEGLALHNGNISTDIGGGLCQLGNLLYWMTLHTPLTIKERWRHGYDVFPDVNRTIPFACGATLSYNYIDLQLENKTSHSFQIFLWLDDKNLNGEIRCNENLNLDYRIYETDHLFQHQWWGGYTRHNKIWKSIHDKSTGLTTEELVSENNAIMMYNPLIEK